MLAKEPPPPLFQKGAKPGGVLLLIPEREFSEKEQNQGGSFAKGGSFTKGGSFANIWTDVLLNNY